MTGAKAQSGAALHRGSESHLSVCDFGIVGGKMAALETRHTNKRLGSLKRQLHVDSFYSNNNNRNTI